MEYRVIEVKWSRDGSFVGAPPISNKQSEISKVLNKAARDGWTLSAIHHEVGAHLRFSIITFERPSQEPAESTEPE